MTDSIERNKLPIHAHERTFLKTAGAFMGREGFLILTEFAESAKVANSNIVSQLIITNITNQRPIGGQGGKRMGKLHRMRKRLCAENG